MDSYVTPAGIIAVGALGVSGISAIYLNNQINELKSSLDEVERKLAKTVRVTSRTNKSLVNDMRESIQKHQRLVNGMQKTMNELLESSSKIEEDVSYTNKRMDNLINYIQNNVDDKFQDYSLDDYSYDDSSYYRSESVMNRNKRSDENRSRDGISRNRSGNRDGVNEISRSRDDYNSSNNNGYGESEYSGRKNIDRTSRRKGNRRKDDSDDDYEVSTSRRSHNYDDDDEDDELFEQMRSFRGR